MNLIEILDKKSIIDLITSLPVNKKSSKKTRFDKTIRLGLCCLNTELRAGKPSIYPSRRMIVRTVKRDGLDKLREKIRQNLTDVLTMMDWNKRHNIHVFRLSSDLFPHKSNPEIVDYFRETDEYNFDFAIDLLHEIGQLAKKLEQRLTFHPGQYNVVGTPKSDVFQKTSNELLYHAQVLDLMNCPVDSVMVVHGGGIYGDKEATKKRWIEQFRQLPEPVRQRLVLENCEKNFNVEDCLDISAEIDIPVVFDTHHYDCYNLLHPDETLKPARDYICNILETWTRRGIKPKFHVSEQGDGKIGKHSDFIETIPEYLLEIPEIYGIEIDIMIEAKMKEQAIFKLYQKYPFLDFEL